MLDLAAQSRLVRLYRALLDRDSRALPRSSAPNVRLVDACAIDDPCQALADLEHAWQGIGEQRPYIANSLSREYPEDWDGSPLHAMVSLLSQGLYPPPELLLAIRHCFLSYLVREGEVTLEECFFGRESSGPKGGPYAKRESRKLREFAMRAEFYAPMAIEDDGIFIDWHTLLSESSETDAAARVIARMGLGIDPASFIRTMKANSPLPKRARGRPRGSRKKLEK